MPAFLLFGPRVVVSRQAIIAVAFLNACNELGIEGARRVTSGNDGAHMAGSLHYQDRALDFRTRDLAPAVKPRLLATLRRRLGPDYTVILEDEHGANEHLHAEHDPPSAGKHTKYRDQVAARAGVTAFRAPKTAISVQQGGKHKKRAGPRSGNRPR